MGGGVVARALVLSFTVLVVAVVAASVGDVAALLSPATSAAEVRDAVRAAGHDQIAEVPDDVIAHVAGDVCGPHNGGLIAPLASALSAAGQTGLDAAYLDAVRDATRDVYCPDVERVPTF